MTYDGTGEVSAVHVGDQDSRALSLGATTGRLIATGDLTNREFGLFRWEMSAPGGAEPHFHRTFSESFYVLSGKVAIYDGRCRQNAGPGDFCYVPPGGVHGFRNAADESSMLILFAPGPPREHYFEELAEMISTGRQLTDDERTEFYERHDTFMV